MMSYPPNICQVYVHRTSCLFLIWAIFLTFFFFHLLFNHFLLFCPLCVGDDDGFSAAAMEWYTESLEGETMFTEGMASESKAIMIYTHNHTQNLYHDDSMFLFLSLECNCLLFSARSWRVHAQQHGSGLAWTGAEVTRSTGRGVTGGAEGAGVGTTWRPGASFLQGEDRDPVPGS